MTNKSFYPSLTDPYLKLTLIPGSVDMILDKADGKWHKFDPSGSDYHFATGTPICLQDGKGTERYYPNGYLYNLRVYNAKTKVEVTFKGRTVVVDRFRYNYSPQMTNEDGSVTLYDAVSEYTYIETTDGECIRSDGPWSEKWYFFADSTYSDFTVQAFDTTQEGQPTTIRVRFL